MNSGIFTVGVIILILGIFAFGYAAFFEDLVDNSFGEGVIGSYAIPMIGLGIVVMLIGALIPSISTTTHSGATRANPVHATSTRRTVTTISED
ncbi:MAG: hypothetical protein Q8Q31_02265 [Nanoarchaeota archaeon]|nr:hypothetical protein [Nanoarchaeota archaeon]